MKSILYYIGIAAVCMLVSSCGASKKLASSPIETFDMPCAEFTSGDGSLRAWASGASDNQMAARKKAQSAAAAQLAAMLKQVVETTTQDYTTVLTEGNSSGSKSLLNQKISIVVNQALAGATIACEKWNKDEATGQYTNYMVMELRGQDFLEQLYNELTKTDNVKFDRNQLEELFLKHINEASKNNK